jgi:hypothetical protein
MLILLPQADIRRTNVATKLKVTYLKDEYLDVAIQYKAWDEWTHCFRVTGLSLPISPFLGFSAMTGDVHDAHEYDSTSLRSNQSRLTKMCHFSASSPSRPPPPFFPPSPGHVTDSNPPPSELHPHLPSPSPSSSSSLLPVAVDTTVGNNTSVPDVGAVADMVDTVVDLAERSGLEGVKTSIRARRASENG